MISRFKTATMVAAALGIMGTGAAYAEQFSDKDKAEIGAIIKEYLLENPEVIFEAVDKHREKEEAQAQKNAEAKIAEHAAYLTRDGAPSVGNPEGDVTVIEFFDYNCGYCKRALGDIQKAIKDDDNVRVVFKEMAILGPQSRTAALWSLAAHKQEKYFDFHVALMNHRGPKNDTELMKLAEKVGLDAELLKADANSEAIAAQLEKDMKIAREIGVQGTPAFVVGSQFIPGYIGEDGLKEAIAQARK